ncbi:Gustatory receptor 25b [Halyomorpha halys]|nr:Gustatory receptor 25b [Halyomorpha halys]
MGTYVGRKVLKVTKPLKLFALFPLSLDNESGNLQVSIPMLVLSSLICCAYTVTNIILCMIHGIFPNNILQTAKIYSFTSILLNCVPLLSIFELLNKLENLNKLARFLDIAESKIHELGIRVDNSCSLRHLLINGCLTVGAFFVRLRRNDLRCPNGFLTYLMKTVYKHLLLGNMVVLVHCYTSLLATLRIMFTACKRALLQWKISPSQNIKTLEKLVHAHNILSICSRIINKMHGMRVVIIILTSFVFSLSGAYRSYEILSLARQGAGVAYYALLDKLIWVTVCFNLCLQIVLTSRKCSKEAKEFNTQLYQLMIDDTTNDISNNKKLRLHIAMKREVVFTACGFFTLDYTLVHSMIAAATTYLVILIQFGQHQSTAPELPANPPDFSNTTALPLSTSTI